MCKWSKNNLFSSGRVKATERLPDRIYKTINKNYLALSSALESCKIVQRQKKTRIRYLKEYDFKNV